MFSKLTVNLSKQTLKRLNYDHFLLGQDKQRAHFRNIFLSKGSKQTVILREKKTLGVRRTTSVQIFVKYAFEKATNRHLFLKKKKKNPGKICESISKCRAAFAEIEFAFHKATNRKLFLRKKHNPDENLSKYLEN